MPEHRWWVERPSSDGTPHLDGLLADSMEVTSGGVLIFRDDTMATVMAYAPSAWLTACPDTD